MKPNLFIVGAAKAGTTSLYHYLDEHPDIFMSEIKETNYFSYDEIKAQGLFYNEEHISTLLQYENLFKISGTAKILGEASVSYLFYPAVAEKIKHYNTNAKIIILLRNPIDRAYSHYLMDKRLGFVNLSFEDIIHKKGPHPKLHLFYQQYIELGFYYQQIERYLSVFNPEAVKVFLYEDIVKNITETIKSIYKFLEVDDSFQPQTEKSHNAFAQPKNKLLEKLYASKKIRQLAKGFAGNKVEVLKNKLMSKDKKIQLSSNLRKELLDLYRSDISLTQTIIYRDLSNWLH